MLLLFVHEAKMTYVCKNGEYITNNISLKALCILVVSTLKIAARFRVYMHAHAPVLIQVE